MPETREDIEQQLLEYQHELKSNEEAIHETRKLLEKADTRKHSNPADLSKWNRTIENLERSLSEKKRLVSSLKMSIIQVTRKLESGRFSDESAVVPPEPTPAPAPEPVSIPENLSLDDLKAAVARVLGTHIIKVHSISDLDYRLSKALLESRAGKSISSNDTAELRKRLSILEKSRPSLRIKATYLAKSSEAEAAPVEPEEAQSPHAVQVALKKCADKAFDTLTLEEMEMLAKYGRVLALQKDVKKKELLPLIRSSLTTIQQRVTKLDFD